MNETDPRISHYLAELDGQKSANAFHRLREVGSTAIPDLQTALRATKSSHVKAQIVELLWQTREPSVVGSLAEALNDRAPAVWKAALDGLVTIRDSSAARVLREALAASESGKHHVPVEWLREALEQHETPQ